VPDDTTLVRVRARGGEAGIREVFDALNQPWAAAGLLGTERRVLDGVHRWAKVARQSWVGLLHQGRRVLVDTLAQVDGPRAATLRAQCVPPAEEAELRTTARGRSRASGRPRWWRQWPTWRTRQSRRGWPKCRRFSAVRAIGS
jgi:hypothetical protein